MVAKILDNVYVLMSASVSQRGPHVSDISDTTDSDRQ